MDSLNIEAFANLITSAKPYATAFLKGNKENPHISGLVSFYPAAKGTQVVAEVFGLPSKVYVKGKVENAGPFYAFHIHEGESCRETKGGEPFELSGGHFNPGNRPHPYHAGDMPPLLADNGYAYLSFFTGRFAPKQVVGRTVIIHQGTDDFHTQPAGNPGGKLACGLITPVLR